MRSLLDRLEEGFIAFLLAAMTLVTFSQVVARYVFNAGAVWALELTTYLFAWLVLFGMSYGIKVGAHLGVDVFVKLAPPRGQRLLTLLAALCCIAYAAILLAGAWQYVSKVYMIGIPAEDLYVPRVIVEAFVEGDYEEVPIPRWIPYSILPIGLALLLLRILQASYEVVTGRREQLTAGHELEEAAREAEKNLMAGDDPIARR